MDTVTIVAISVLGAMYLVSMVAPEVPPKKPTRNGVAFMQVAIVAFSAFIVFALWGEVMVMLFGLPEISYLQAVALVVLRSYLLPSRPTINYRHQLQEYALRKAGENEQKK